MGKALGWDKLHKIYFRSVGLERTARGNLRARTFYLGPNAEEAKQKIREIEAVWGRLKVEGRTEWTIEALKDLVFRGICQMRKPHLHKPLADTVIPPVLTMNPLTLKMRKEITSWFDSNGKIKQEHFVDFQKYCITDMLSFDNNTFTLLEQIQYLWNNDALGTLERISRLGISPTTLNLGVKIDNITNPIVFDATEPTPATVIDISPEEKEAQRLDNLAEYARKGRAVVIANALARREAAPPKEPKNHITSSGFDRLAHLVKIRELRASKAAEKGEDEPTDSHN